jgi:hypothetical protein
MRRACGCVSGPRPLSARPHAAGQALSGISAATLFRDPLPDRVVRTADARPADSAVAAAAGTQAGGSGARSLPCARQTVALTRGAGTATGPKPAPPGPDVGAAVAAAAHEERATVMGATLACVAVAV